MELSLKFFNSERIFLIPLIVILFTSNAHATQKESLFMGADAEYLGYKNYSVAAATILGGYRWSKCSLELGYTKPFSNNFISNNVTDQVVNSGNLYLDAAAYYSLNSKWELLGKLGIGYFMEQRAQEATYYWWEESLGARFGIGLQYNLNCAVKTGISYTLQTTNDKFPTPLNIISIKMVYVLPFP